MMMEVFIVKDGFKFLAHAVVQTKSNTSKRARAPAFYLSVPTPSVVRPNRSVVVVVTLLAS